MRRAMKTPSSSPPIHVHVAESTPVHVHVKKCQKSGSARTPQKSVQEPKMRAEAGNLRPTAQVKTRVPWVPPGKTSTRDALYKWEGPTHRLEITPVPEPEPAQSAALRLSDLSTEEGEVLQGRINQYERKIDSLMTEVSSLKSEVKLQKKEQLLERQSEQLNASQRLIAEQEEELAEVTKELEVTERENSRLRLSMEKMQEETDYSRLEKEALVQEKDALLRKLLEVEVDGAAASRQVSALREAVGRVRTERQLSGTDSTQLSHQKELLLQKLETFEETNRALRHLLKEQHGREVEALRLSEQKDVILKKLADTEAENTLLVVRLQDREKELNQLTVFLETEKENARTTAELSKALESTRAHLQGQLRSKEAENNRLAVQIRKLERAVVQRQGEADQLHAQLRQLRQRGDGDKEALKRSTRVQRERAERSEDAAGQLTAQLLQKEAHLADALATAEAFQNRHAQEAQERSRLEVEVTVLNRRVPGLHLQDHPANSSRRGALDRLHALTSEARPRLSEPEAPQATQSAVEEKLSLSQSELQQVKSSVKQYESLLESYKSQVQKARTDADDYRLQLERAGQEAESLRGEVGREVEAVRAGLLGRLRELEPLPEALKRAELQLREEQALEREQERRLAEHSRALAELRLKVEQQGVQLDASRGKNLALQEENKQLQHQVESLERKLSEASAQNRDLVLVVSKREDAVREHQLRLEEKSRECGALVRQLEEALDDARRQVAQTRERATSKERTAQSKVLELETQLSRTKTDLNQLRRDKEDAERRFQSRLQDVRDRLEQSDSTNRSLQSYVQFLKASYAHVFGDSALTSSALRAPSPV
ncbi:outer dense fiber protein 2 [Anguilla rostrata]|uniref:outer dense fiber protein 2 n=1 Tax=Anguilla rostrata TaxID=7938 RepID=UPI0030CB911F